MDIYMLKYRSPPFIILIKLWYDAYYTLTCVVEARKS